MLARQRNSVERCQIRRRGPTILHVVLNEFTNDGRVLKETAALSRAFPSAGIQIAALKGSGTKEHERLDASRSVWRVPLLLRQLSKDLFSQALKYLEWLARVVLWGLKLRPAVVHTHDLNALPVGALLRLFVGSKVVYDAHELETERNGINGIRRALSIFAERQLIGSASLLITVSQSIANHYGRRFDSANPITIRNIPHRNPGIQSTPSPLREIVGIAEDTLVVIYQGGLFSGRGIDRLISAFKRIGNAHLVVMGDGPLEMTIARAEAECSRIHRVPAVPPDDVLLHTRGADIGACMIEDTCLSYRYSLPNKLFEYLLSGLPVIINGLPDQRAIVERYDCGWILDDSADTGAVVKLLTGISVLEMRAKRQGALRAARELDWSREVEPLVRWYARVLSMSSEVRRFTR